MPGLGRWINRDPLKEEGGLNFYDFVSSNPINNVEEYGLAAVGAQFTGAIDLFGAHGISGGNGSGFGLATSTYGGAGVFVPNNQGMGSATLGAYRGGGGLAIVDHKEVFSTTPVGHSEGVLGLDAGGGLSGFVSNIDNPAELNLMTDTVNVNITIPPLSPAGYKLGGSISWGRNSAGGLTWQANRSGGAEFGWGSVSKYGTTNFWSGQTGTLKGSLWPWLKRKFRSGFRLMCKG